ncbi:MAG: hypothetical protein ABW116_13440 [Candidatus Sedimenticola sp. 20ELBAFRAG]
MAGTYKTDQEIVRDFISEYGLPDDWLEKVATLAVEEQDYANYPKRKRDRELKKLVDSARNMGQILESTFLTYPDVLDLFGNEKLESLGRAVTQCAPSDLGDGLRPAWSFMLPSILGWDDKPNLPDMLYRLADYVEDNPYTPLDERPTVGCPAARVFARILSRSLPILTEGKVKNPWSFIAASARLHFPENAENFDNELVRDWCKTK